MCALTIAELKRDGWKIFGHSTGEKESRAKVDPAYEFNRNLS